MFLIVHTSYIHNSSRNNQYGRLLVYWNSMWDQTWILQNHNESCLRPWTQTGCGRLTRLPQRVSLQLSPAVVMTVRHTRHHIPLKILKNREGQTMNFNIIISHYYTFDYHVYILRESIPIFDNTEWIECWYKDEKPCEREVWGQITKIKW
jgi:hypothetical protein